MERLISVLIMAIPLFFVLLIYMFIEKKPNFKLGIEKGKTPLHSEKCKVYFKFGFPARLAIYDDFWLINFVKSIVLSWSEIINVEFKPGEILIHHENSNHKSPITIMSFKDKDLKDFLAERLAQ